MSRCERSPSQRARVHVDADRQHRGDGNDQDEQVRDRVEQRQREDEVADIAVVDRILDPERLPIHPEQEQPASSPLRSSRSSPQRARIPVTAPGMRRGAADGACLIASKALPIRNEAVNAPTTSTSTSCHLQCERRRPLGRAPGTRGRPGESVTRPKRPPAGARRLPTRGTCAPAASVRSRGPLSRSDPRATPILQRPTAIDQAVRALGRQVCLTSASEVSAAAAFTS